MACANPLNAVRTEGGIRFGQLAPTGPPLLIPCGRCVMCRATQAQQWALRCVHEAQMHRANCFLTLTYRDAELPRDYGLDLRDWQLFHKRLRKRVGPFRYFAVGEYGEQNLRPHYHACVFGVDFSEDRVLLRDGKHRLFTSALLDDVWRKGYCSVGALTFESAAYVARYCLKKVVSPSMPPYGRIDAETGEYFEVRRPFAVMSRNPGVGASWFDKYMSDVYPGDEVVHDGRRFRPPRFYDLKVGEIDPVFLEGVKAARLEKAVVETRERLEVKGEVAERRLTQVGRKL